MVDDLRRPDFGGVAQKALEGSVPRRRAKPKAGRGVNDRRESRAFQRPGQRRRVGPALLGTGED